MHTLVAGIKLHCVQVAMDEAGFLLNRVAAGEGDWDSVRQPLAAKYAEAGLQAMADFVLAGQQ